MHIMQYPSNKRCNAYLADDSLCMCMFGRPNGVLCLFFKSIGGGDGSGGGIVDACRTADNEISSKRNERHRDD